MEQTYFVEWDGPFSTDQLDTDKYGIYQVYGHHPVYGSDVLLYIGRTKTNFAARLADREVVWSNADAKRVQIYCGIVYHDTKILGGDEKIVAIKEIEPLLIYAHFPAANSSNIASLGKEWRKYENIRIVNTGYRRSLLSEVSGLAMVMERKNYLLVDELKDGFAGGWIFSSEKDDDYSLSFGDEHNEFWIGVDGKLWEEKGIPLTVGVWEKDKDKLVQYAEKKSDLIACSDENGHRYFAVPLDVDLETARQAVIHMKKLFGLK